MDKPKSSYFDASSLRSPLDEISSRQLDIKSTEEVQVEDVGQRWWKVDEITKK